jgi:microcystin-dependent protein
MTQRRLVYPTFGGLNIAQDGYFNANNNTLSKVGEPVALADACTKRYVTTKLFAVGDLKWSIRNSDEGFWLLCDGRPLTRSEYPELYSVIGFSFGSDEDGSFYLPDCRGRALAAAGHGSGLSSRAIGEKTGNESHTLITDELPSHNHSGTTASSGAHNHGGATGSDGTHSHTSNATGGSNSLGLATSDGTNTVTSTDPTANEINVWTTPQALTINDAGDHTHTISTDGAHTHTFTTSSVGGGDSFSIMQPTIFIGNVFMFVGERKGGSVASSVPISYSD